MIFHGYISQDLLAQSRSPGQPFTANGIRVLVNAWMRPGAPATFVLNEHDVDVPGTLSAGEIMERAVCFIFPGHLGPGNAAITDGTEAIRHICESYFGDCAQARVILEDLVRGAGPTAKKQAKLAQLEAQLEQVTADIAEFREELR